MPLAGANAIFFTAEGQPPVTAQNVPRAYVHRVSPNSSTRCASASSPAGPSTRARCRAWRRGDRERDRRQTLLAGPGPHRQAHQAGRRRTGRIPGWTIVGVVNEMKYRGLPEQPDGRSRPLPARSPSGSGSSRSCCAPRSTPLRSRPRAQGAARGRPDHGDLRRVTMEN